MTAPFQQPDAELDSYAKRIVEAFVSKEPVRPNDHLGSFFGFLKGSHSRSNYTEAGLRLECTFLKTSWEAWYAFVSMRRRKSRGDDKAVYRKLYDEVEGLSPSKQEDLASRVANKLSPELKAAADHARGDDKRLKWQEERGLSESSAGVTFTANRRRQHNHRFGAVSRENHQKVATAGLESRSVFQCPFDSRACRR